MKTTLTFLLIVGLLQTGLAKPPPLEGTIRAGHMLNMEKPEAFNREVVAFLQSDN